MFDVNELIKTYYNEFQGLPSNNPIVRNGQQDDAFEVAVLDILYGKQLGLTFNKSNISEISKYIIAPPDGGIDLFIEKTVGDESTFDVIQVKNSAETPTELKAAMTYMKRTISDYCKDPMKVQSDNCREMLSNSSLDKNSKGSCEYYVVHAGDVQDYKGSRDDEHIITKNELVILKSNLEDCVEEDDFIIDGNNNFLNYGTDPNKRAIICNINGYDLAKLNNAYYSTEVGRNILFGWNLRESLNAKRSKSYDGMKNTIEHCPDNFWFYNNGITILAEEAKEENEGDKTRIKLKRFSIVNGAQTTSSLGQILKEAKRDGDEQKINALKEVYVMARILQVADTGIAKDIAIFNNTQNPINSRDMVAQRDEQKKLYELLIDDTYPKIYMEIRNGAQVPNTFNKLFVHRKTTNEEMAQLAYASFFMKPFTAKDKKSALFTNDYSQNTYTLNKIYHDVFNYDETNSSNSGILFQKTKNEIDEALFVQYLYKENKKYLRKIYQDRLSKEQHKRETTTDPNLLAGIQSRIENYESALEVVGICMYYYIALYYEFKEQFEDDHNKRFDFEKFYQEKQYKQEVIEESAKLFLALTVEQLRKTARENGKAANVNNWVRSSSCEDKFFESLRNEISANIDLEGKYRDFMSKYRKIAVD